MKPEVGIEIDDRRDQHAGDAADGGADGPRQREDALDAHAHEPRRRLALGRGPHGHARLRELEEQIERQHDHQREADDAHVHRGEAEDAEPDGVLREDGRQRQHVVAVDDARRGAQDDRGADGGDDDAEDRRVHDGAHHHPLQHHAHEARQDDGDEEDQPVRQPSTRSAACS